MIELVAAAIITCTSLTVIDGDGIKCDGQSMRLLGDGVPFKSGIDTPEIGSRAKCAKERLLGEQAKLRLQELLRQDVRIEDSGRRDRFDRPLVRVRLPNGKTAGEVLLAEGYAGRWRPGREINWCK